MRLIGIAALATNHVIGNKFVLPWHVPEDLRHFREQTLEHAVILGSTTFRHMPLLDQRDVYVLTTEPKAVLRALAVKVDALKHPKDISVITCGSLEEAYAHIEAAGHDRAFVAGGAKVYAEALPHLDELLLTRIETCPEGDSVFPPWQEHLLLTECGETHLSRSWLRFRFEKWEKRETKGSRIANPGLLGAAGHPWQ